MRVAFITPSLTLGGAERSLAKTVMAIYEYAERVDVIVLADVHQAVVAELPSSTGFHILRGSSSANPLTWIKVRRILDRVQPNVVVGWSTYGNFVAIVATRWRAAWTVIVSERNYVPQILSRRRIGKVKRFVVLSLMRMLYRRARVVTANSIDNVRFLKKFIGRGPAYAHLPNSINMAQVLTLAEQRPERPPSHAEGPRILALGRLDSQKGFDVLLRAFAIVRRNYAWRLVLVGDGPDRAALQALAREVGIEEAVEWIGAIANPFPYYQWADLVVMPSRFEGFPNVALEAMSCGKPVICADCKTGPREVTQNGRYGLLVKVNDAESLAEAIVALGRDADRRVQLGRLAQNHVRATYDVACTKPVYASILCLTH